MSTKYPGGFITKSPVAPTTTAASGIWTLDQQQQAQKAGTWPSPPIFIEDLFSTYLYTGTDATQTITNGIDLAGKGGLVWTKTRSDSGSNWVTDSARGNLRLNTNSTAAESATGSVIFNSDGFTVDSTFAGLFTYASWTFREQDRFFDIVTYSGNSTNRTVAHNLGSVPGCIIVRDLQGGNWNVYHRSLANTQALELNSTSAVGSAPTYWNSTTATATEFSLGTSSQVNFSGHDYVAYLFAHNAGGFPASGSGSTNGISCGSFTTNSSGWASIDLGYEPQWVLYKNITNADEWYITDITRGQTTGSTTSVSTDPNTNTVWLKPNSSAAEVTNFPTYGIKTQTSGFTNVGGGGTSASSTYIYIAIRRGPMKTPTVGTSVFSPEVQTPTGGANNNMAANSGFPIDWLPTKQNTGVTDWFQTSRLTNNYMSPNTDAVEGSYTYGFDRMAGVGGGSSGWNTNSTVSYAFRRAPGFFDVVCYTGTGATQTITHNLGAVPELMIWKRRAGGTAYWVVGSNFGTSNFWLLYLNDPYGGAQPNYTYSGSGQLTAAPTSTSWSVTGTSSDANASGSTYVTYLFATVAGVSKVGTYTGTGALQTINCGFAGGARFVLIKRASASGAWYVWDTARGMVSGTDPQLVINSTSAEVNQNSVYTIATGFQLLASPAADVNISGSTYLFLAIA